MNLPSTRNGRHIVYQVLKAPLLRIFIYSALVALLTQFMSWDALHMPTDEKFSEGSLTEDAQLVFLFLSSLILLYMSFRRILFSDIALLFAGFTLTSLIRELDNVFDRLVGSWQYPAYAITVAILFRCWHNRHKLVQEIQEYTNTISFGLFLSGFLTTYVFSRLFGAKTFWYAVLEDKYHRVAKNAAEEGPELYGYFLILLSVFELYIMAVYILKKTK